MDKPQAIARLNIEHYRPQLEAETDPARREALAKLLAEQEAKLNQLETVQKCKRHI